MLEDQKTYPTDLASREEKMGFALHIGKFADPNVFGELTAFPAILCLIGPSDAIFKRLDFGGLIRFQHYFHGDRGEPTATGWYPVSDKMWDDAVTAVTEAEPECPIPFFKRAKRVEHGLHR